MSLHVTTDTANQTSHEALRELQRAFDAAQSVLGRNGDTLAAIRLRRALADVRYADQFFVDPPRATPDAVR